MKILVNGQERDVPSGITIARLLESLEMTARGVAVEVNLELIPRARHAEHELQESDQLEIVTLVGGG